jgi:hypothetical protein
MENYIDKQDLIRFLDNLQQPKMPITKGFKYISIEEAIRVVSERPTVKAIPLDKVKQAREEIQKLRGCSCSCSDGIIDDVEDILDELIIESEG